MKRSRFHGVYLLFNVDPKIRNKCYVGYTTHPQRRIRQHNEGWGRGGARKTSGRGTWTMCLIVHGFPNDVIALRFEWAWQNPLLSKRLRHVDLARDSKEPLFEYHVRVMYNMLCCPPWNRLALTVQWFDAKRFLPHPSGLSLPEEVQVDTGDIDMGDYAPHTADLVLAVGSPCAVCREPVKMIRFSADVVSAGDEFNQRGFFSPSLCLLVLTRLLATQIRQKSPLLCPLRCEGGVWHVTCLARVLMSADTGLLLPLPSKCPQCRLADMVWPRLLRNWEAHPTLLSSTASNSQPTQHHSLPQEPLASSPIFTDDEDVFA